MEAVTEVKTEEKEVPQIKVEDKKPQERKERYFVIRLAAMRDKTDIEQPVITVGNKRVKHQRIQFRRQTWVPVTGSHVEVLRNTKYPVYTSTEENGTARKSQEWRMRFPIDEIIEITEEGYKALRAKVLSFTMDSQKLTMADIEPFKV